jgi:N-acetylmuramic acid 6-phosphate etherase
LRRHSIGRPTFDWPADKLVLVIAGGERALHQAIENAEDSADAGTARVAEIHIGPDDAVLGLSASGNTPFTVGAVKAARERGALTIGIANNSGSTLPATADHAIVIDTGAEPIAGSTRLKAGTAQKVVLNLFSTLVMTRLDRVYGGLMVDMRATTAKLRRRAVRMVMTIAGCSEAAATQALAEAAGSVKLAALIASGGGKAAQTVLDKHGGNLRQAMTEIGRR